MNIRTLVFFTIVLFIILFACKKDELDFDKMTGIEVEREIAMPLIKGSYTFENIINDDFDSIDIVGVDTIKFYFDVQINYEDTVELSDFGDNLEIEYANVHYWFTNGIPIGLDITLLLYDSTQQRVIDSIPFSDNPSEIFLEAAPVDLNGRVLISELEERNGIIEINQGRADNLLHHSTHLIIKSHLVTADLNVITIINESYLNFHLSLEAKVTYRE